MEDEGLFVLIGVIHPSVKMFISISKLDSVLDIKDSVSDAVKLIMLQTLQNQLNTDTDDDSAEEE
jgi:hypothetical protein